MGTIARRLLQLVVVVVLSTLFAFALLRLFPGDAADAVLPFGTKAQKAQFRADNGLDKPFFEQYATWLGNLVQGDFGKDYQSNTPVADKLADRAAGVAAADALRADPGARRRDPARRVHRVPRRHQVGPLAQRGRVRAAGAARASCSRSRSRTGSG